MRTIDLDSLEIFRTVVAEGGVIRAADKLNRVQSNVTTRIQQLEERLGQKLFHRQGRSLALAPAGHKLLPYAERLLRLADEAESELRSDLPLGTFRLGSLESTAGSRLAPVLSRFHRLYPGVVVELVDRHHRRLAQAGQGLRARGRLRVASPSPRRSSKRCPCSTKSWC